MKVDLACKCGSKDFEWEGDLSDSTVVSCTKCGKSDTKRAIMKRVERQLVKSLERDLQKRLKH